MPTCSVGCVVNSDLTCAQGKIGGKTPIGVVVAANGNDRIVMNLEDSATMLWGPQEVNITEIPNISDGDTDAALNDVYGKSYTASWIDLHGDDDSYALGYCYNYTTSGTSKGQWYLPALGEVWAIRQNLLEATVGFLMADGTIFPSQVEGIDGFWTSSEGGHGYQGCYNINELGSNYGICVDKILFSRDEKLTVRCTLPVVSNDNGTVSVCGADYRYACVGDGYSGGSGDVCGKMYKACQCASGYSWDGSHCVRSCDVGYILNSDKTCTKNKESGKTPIGIIAYADGNTRLAVNLPEGSDLIWGMVDYVETDVPGLTNYDTAATALTDMNGKQNTSIMTSFLNTDEYGAKYCTDFSTTGTSKGQWYLPSLGEFSKGLIDNYSPIAIGLAKAGGDAFVIPRAYGTSTEYSATDTWWAVPGYTWISGKKNSLNYARCYLAMEDQGSNTVNLCGADYKYTCEGENITGGSGSTCAGLYSACTCASGYSWSNGACVLPPNVGDILYSDMTWSSTLDSSKTPIGVVSYVNGDTRLAISLERTTMQWGGDGTDISGLTNINSSSVAMNDFSGKSNTSKIVSTLGTSSTSYAARYCRNYMTSGTSKKDWYLPAAGELYASIWTNQSAVNSGLSAAGGTAIQSGYHWSSSEYSDLYAWIVNASGGYVNKDYKEHHFDVVRCVLAF